MSVTPFLDYLLLEKKYSLHTHKAYRSDLKAFQAFEQFCKSSCDDTILIKFPISKSLMD